MYFDFLPEAEGHHSDRMSGSQKMKKGVRFPLERVLLSRYFISHHSDIQVSCLLQGEMHERNASTSCCCIYGIWA